MHAAGLQRVRRNTLVSSVGNENIRCQHAHQAISSLGLGRQAFARQTPERYKSVQTDSTASGTAPLRIKSEVPANCVGFGDPSDVDMSCSVLFPSDPHKQTPNSGTHDSL